MAKKLEQTLYTAHTRTTGGREGSGRSSDGELAVKLGTPGAGKPGTNPEQLFGVGAGQKQQLIDTAHQTCPYSAAIRGNLDVEFGIARSEERRVGTECVSPCRTRGS